MSYSLVLAEEPSGARDVGENVFLADLSDEYQVFAFYYPSAMRDEQLEAALRSLGELTGKNLFVNMGKLNDPSYGKIVKRFEIRTLPAVVVTATSDLAGDPDANANAFIRLDDDRLLSDPDRTLRLLQEIYSLFVSGDVARAMSRVSWVERTEGIRALAKRIADGLRHLANFVAERDIKVSIVEGSFELVKRADP